MGDLRKAVPAIRVSSSASVPVRVQYLGNGVPVYPEFAVAPGGNHITIQPAGLQQIECSSNKPRMSRFIKVEGGFWLNGEFHVLPPAKPEPPAAAP
jgi:hypothetical protein